MSLVALILNLTLGALLVGAIILGQRLDRRLRALRASHNSFAKAVSELDQAALRTQSGLAELKEAAEDARTALAERIDTARALSERLDKQIAEAEAKAEFLTKSHAAIRAPRPILLRTQVEAPAQAADPAPAPMTEPAAARPALRPFPVSRSRAAVDDELFEAPRPALAALAGGRR
jgi:septal ring factor EnvC (AmiA/AmiB activator)